MKFLVWHFLLINILFIAGCNLSPGSYPNAELYELEVNEASLILAADRFKKSNPEFILPKEFPLADGRINDKDHWYHLYFYDSDNNQVMKTWIRGVGKNRTKIALVAVYDSGFQNRWKYVNKDFDTKENKRVKKNFEKMILSPLKSCIQLSPDC